MRNPNGYGTIVKMTGNRRKPYACRKIIGWKEDGKPIIKYLSYHRTKREAEKALKEYNDDPYRISDYTLADVYKEWYAQQALSRSDGTLAGYRGYWKKLEPLHDVKMQKIDRFVLQDFFDSTEMTEDTADRVRLLLKQLIEYAVKLCILPISALELHKAINYQPSLKTSKRGGSVFTQAELDYLWEHKDNEMVRIILVYTYTGARFAELYDLRPENCHDDHIDITHAKTEAGIRCIPLSDKVRDLLPIAPIPPHTSYWSAFKVIFPNHKPHDTRHTFISLMTEAGVDDRIIKAIVGHKPKDITGHYTHISLEAMLEAVNKI